MVLQKSEKEKNEEAQLAAKNIGIIQYFTAKRAAIRLRAFAKRYHEDKMLQEQRIETREMRRNFRLSREVET